MLKESSNLVDVVAETLTRNERSHAPMFSPEAIEAMRLADLYSAIEPEKFVVPMSAMIGFTLPKS